jgi:hypothetical protein
MDLKQAGRRGLALSAALVTLSGASLAVAATAGAGSPGRTTSRHVSVVPATHLRVGQTVTVKYRSLTKSGVSDPMGRPYYVVGRKYIAAECGYVTDNSIGCTRMKGKSIKLPRSATGSIKMTLVRGSGPNCEKYKCGVVFINMTKNWDSNSLPLGFSKAMPKLAPPKKR